MPRLAQQVETRNLRLLLFDTDRTNIMLVEACATSLGCKLLSATSERQAKDALETWEPDLVVLELTREGLAVLQSLRENAKHQHKPAVMLTSTLSRDARLRAIQANADDIFERPIDVTLFVARLKTLIERQHALTRIAQPDRDTVDGELNFVLSEIRSSLSPIADAQAASLQELEVNPDKSRELLRDALELTRSLKYVLRDFDLLRNLDRHAKPRRADLLPLQSLARAVIARTRSSAERLGLRLVSQLETERTIAVHGEIITHLLENLLEFVLRQTSAPHRIALLIVDRPRDADFPLEICVQSTGRYPEALGTANIFELRKIRVPYSESRARAMNGGLGLYFCQRVVQTLLGRIELTHSEEYPWGIRVLLPSAVCQLQPFAH